MIRRRLDQMSETGLSKLRSAWPGFASRPSLSRAVSAAATPLARSQSVAARSSDPLGSASVPILTYPPTATAFQLGDELSPRNGGLSNSDRFFADSSAGVIQTMRSPSPSTLPLSSSPPSAFTSSRSPLPEDDTQEVPASVIADAVLQSISTPLPLSPPTFSAAGAANAFPEYTGADLSSPSSERPSAVPAVSSQFPGSSSPPFVHSAATSTASTPSGAFRPV